jgi:hypothetical protein
MKSFISLIVVLALTMTTLAQETNNVNELNEFSKNIKLPAVVIKKVGEDFSIYLPEIENLDRKIHYIQNKFIAYDLGKDFEGYDNYLVTLKIKDAILIATYNEKGKLIEVVEKYSNVKLPKKVANSISEKYPGWHIIKGKYTYSQENGAVKTRQYDILLKKDNKAKKIVLTNNGEELKKNKKRHRKV